MNGMLQSRFALFWFAVAILGCGSDESPPTPPSPADGGDECTVIAADAFKPISTFWLTSPYEPETGTDAPDFLSIQFFESEGETLAPGTFELGGANNENYETCSLCVRVDEDDTETKKTYFQQSGSITLTTASSPPSVRSAGSLTDVKLVEVTIDPTTRRSSPVQDGSCLIVESATWDTTQLQDSVCADVSDCQPCCADFHREGVQAGLAIMRQCGCIECGQECHESFCALTPAAASEECQACLEQSLEPAHNCFEIGIPECENDPDCKGLLDCVNAAGCGFLP